MNNGERRTGGRLHLIVFGVERKRTWPQGTQPEIRASEMKGWVRRVRDHGICVYCGRSAIQTDHVIPYRLGGPTWTRNLVACCRSCNLRKHSRLPIDMITKAISYLEGQGEDMGWLYEYCYRVQKLREDISTAEILAALLRLLLPGSVVEEGQGISKTIIE